MDIPGRFASMGLWVSGSHDPGETASETASETACNLMMRPGDAGDEATGESHKCMHVAPVDGSSVHFFSFAAIAFFRTLPRLVAG